MRASSFVFAAVAGVAIGFLGTPGANAMTTTSPAGARVATEALDTSALVHCRSYRHWHPWEHRRTYGCGGGASIEIRRGHHVGVGVHERSRTSIHSRTSVSRGETSVRSRTGTSTSGQTTTKSGASTTSKSGASTGATTSKSGTSGATTGRGQGGEKSSSGGGMSGSSGGQSGGQKQ